MWICIYCYTSENKLKTFPKPKQSNRKISRKMFLFNRLRFETKRSNRRGDWLMEQDSKIQTKESDAPPQPVRTFGMDELEKDLFTHTHTAHSQCGFCVRAAVQDKRGRLLFLFVFEHVRIVARLNRSKRPRPTQAPSVRRFPKVLQIKLRSERNKNAPSFFFQSLSWTYRHFCLIDSADCGGRLIWKLKGAWVIGLESRGAEAAAAPSVLKKHVSHPGHVLSAPSRDDCPSTRLCASPLITFHYWRLVASFLSICFAIPSQRIKVKRTCRFVRRPTAFVADRCATRSTRVKIGLQVARPADKSIPINRV